MGDAPEKRGSIARNRRFSAALVMPVAKPVLKFQPTYRLEPKIPLNKETCEKIIKTVVDNTFEDFTYNPKTALILSSQVSEEIKNRVKANNYDRYRYVCIVTIGEKAMQGFCNMINFLWDETKDGYIPYVYDTPNFFVLATLYYFYYD